MKELMSTEEFYKEKKNTKENRLLSKEVSLRIQTETKDKSLMTPLVQQISLLRAMHKMLLHRTGINMKLDLSLRQRYYKTREYLQNGIHQEELPTSQVYQP
jgi:hypothetical protein